MILNNDSFTRSSVGLVEILSIEFNFVPLALPADNSHIYSYLLLLNSPYILYLFLDMSISIIKM